MKTNYLIIHSSFLHDLEKQVDKKMMEGYTPHGDIFTHQGSLCQAMILDKKATPSAGYDSDFVGDDGIK